MDFLIDLAGFVVKAVIIVVAIAAVLGLLFGALRRGRYREPEGAIRITSLNRRFEDLALSIKRGVMDRKAFKQELKKIRSRDKKKPKPDGGKRTFVVDFQGDLTASATTSLRHQVTALLQTMASGDEVVVRLESPGGKANAYGYAAAQLKRIRDRGFRLTVCVDHIAASGGYMMAAVADRILAAPFALLGSVGVLAMVPNLHRFLQRHYIDYEEITAGEYKRPISFLAENTTKGREKFIEDLEEFHAHFKRFVAENRPSVDVDEIATGEIWFGDNALKRNLVDELQCSDDYLMKAADEGEVYRVDYHQPKSLRQKLNRVFVDSADSLISRIWDRLHRLSII